MAGCNKDMQVCIPKGFDYKEITVQCGSTSPSGSPYLCDKCEKQYADVDWRHEAEMNGEAWGPEDY